MERRGKNSVLDSHWEEIKLFFFVVVSFLYSFKQPELLLFIILYSVLGRCNCHIAKDGLHRVWSFLLWLFRPTHCACLSLLDFSGNSQAIKSSQSLQVIRKISVQQFKGAAQFNNKTSELHLKFEISPSPNLLLLLWDGK